MFANFRQRLGSSGRSRLAGGTGHNRELADF